MRLFISIFIAVLLTGCSGFSSKSTKSALATGAGAAGGGALGYAASDGDPLWTAVGAGGGAVLGNMAAGYTDSEEQQAFEGGYVQGRADSIKDLYWLQQRNEKHNDAYGASSHDAERMRYYTVPASTVREDGTNLVPHTITVPVVE